MRYKNVYPALWNNADANAIGMALYSQSPAVDALLSGMRPPKFLDKGDVDGIFEKLHDALRNEITHTKYQDTVDHNVAEWVAKAILVRGLAFNGSTVSEWGRRLTTANFNSNRSGFYTSYYMTAMRRKAGFDPAARLKQAMDAVQKGVATGYAHTLNDLNSMDELVYRTSTVAYDTCLADRPQTQDDVKQELAEPMPRKYRFSRGRMARHVMTMKSLRTLMRMRRISLLLRRHLRLLPRHLSR